MSKMTTFAPLTKLRPFKDNWRIQVKCLHSWKQSTPYGGDSFDMVLADQWVRFLTNTSFHCIINFENVSNMTVFFLG